MSSWDKDKNWSDLYLPQIRAIVGPLLLEPAPLEMDLREATDLKILKARDMRIACRLRRPGYADRYPFEFTIRSQRHHNKTELEKILNGFGDWAFYGHVDNAERLNRYLLLDLDWFRAVIFYDNNHHRWLPANGVAVEKMNFDKSSVFMAYDVRYFPPEMVIATSHAIPFESLLSWEHLRQTMNVTSRKAA